MDATLIFFHRFFSCFPPNVVYFIQQQKLPKETFGEFIHFYKTHGCKCTKTNGAPDLLCLFLCRSDISSLTFFCLSLDHVKSWAKHANLRVIILRGMIHYESTPSILFKSCEVRTFRNFKVRIDMSDQHKNK